MIAGGNGRNPQVFAAMNTKINMDVIHMLAAGGNEYSVLNWTNKKQLRIKAAHAQTPVATMACVLRRIKYNSEFVTNVKTRRTNAVNWATVKLLKPVVFLSVSEIMSTA
jgi:hypothetical protein